MTDGEINRVFRDVTNTAKESQGNNKRLKLMDRNGISADRDEKFQRKLNDPD